SAHAGSVHGGMRRLYFTSRCPNRVVFRVARVAKHWGFACAGLSTIHDGGGCRIRTFCVMF
ncbi:MAG: hypothetical protein ACKOAH_30190, partial [Pirellula sp.]